MDFRHLRAFIAVAAESSVTKAAARLHISQPPLSRHIRQLEEELGITLFVRHRQGVRLTDAGASLLEKAKVLAAAASDFYETAGQTTRNEANRVRVGIAWGLWESVNRVRVASARQFANLSIEATDVLCADHYNEQLQNGSLDVVFARPPFDTNTIDQVTLYQEPILAVVSEDSPLASRKTLRLRDLASETILLWDRHIMPYLFDKIYGPVRARGARSAHAADAGRGSVQPGGTDDGGAGQGRLPVHGHPADIAARGQRRRRRAGRQTQTPRSTSASPGARARRHLRCVSSSIRSGTSFRSRGQVRPPRERRPDEPPDDTSIGAFRGSIMSYVSRVVDLLDPSLNTFANVSLDDARRRVFSGDPAAVRAIDGSFALVASEGITVRLARSMDRPMRYFLAKRHEGPALYVADRIDTLHRALASDGLDAQFHPSYTRMVPAHHVVELALVGCPDPSPTYTRFFTPERAALPADLDEIGRRYIEALADEIAKWLSRIDRARDPIGVAFSGGIDSGSVFLVTYHTMLRLGMSPQRLKAFVLELLTGRRARISIRRAPFSRRRVCRSSSRRFRRPPAISTRARPSSVLEDYKALDVECAAMGLRLCRGIRERYPEWRHLADGDGGDENLKDYPIEENTELTIRSVVDNLMLYQEGWGVGRIKHSLTYSGGLSRSYVRTYAPARRYGFDGFSPYTRPASWKSPKAFPSPTSRSTTCRRCTR